MGKLVLFLKDANPVEIPLVKERVTIGRRPDNDVCLPNPAVSGEHAAIVTILADSFLEDLGSTNGTLVNGRPVAKHFLRDRDQIDIGRQLLVYLADDGDRAEPPTALRSAGGPGTAASREAPKPARAEPALGAAIDDDLGFAARATRSGASAPSTRPPSAKPADADAPTRAATVADSTETADEAEAALDEEMVAIRQARIDTAVIPPAEPPERPPAAPAPTVRARLRVLTGAAAGDVVPVARDEFVLGRVGVQVAALCDRDGVLTLVPREGASPPTVNGEPVPPEGRTVVPGDGFEVAGARLEVLPRD